MIVSHSLHKSVAVVKMETIISAFFVLEVYHVISHTLVMTGYRTLPRKVLAKQRYYFLADLICSLAALFITGGINVS